MLDERKQKILQAVIQNYISSAEPVGSRTLARKYDLGVSPATIRNEMADLEMLGYLEHIHTSSGRVPSAKGYRLYVDSLLPVQPMSDAEKAMIDSWYKNKVQQLNQVFQETAKLISKLTRNVSLVLAPRIEQAAFRCLQFLPLDDHRVIAVLMTDVGFVENRIMEMPEGACFEDFQGMARVLNESLAGHTLGTIKTKSLNEIEAAIGDRGLYNSALELINKALDSQNKESLYQGGTTELMEQPEFHDVDKVKELLLVLEEDQLMKDILKSHLGDGLSVTIGTENKYQGIQDCSIITATYHLDGELLGSMAVLGPTRMEYGRTMSLLNYMNRNISEVVKRLRY